MIRMIVVSVLAVVLCSSCTHAPSPSSGGPLIGITSIYLEADDHWPARITVPMTYIQAVRDAGGVPVVLPPMDSETVLSTTVARLQGLVLVGGRDIPPAAYAEDVHKSVVEMPATRYESESRLLKAWLLSAKPVLGICLGSQFANVVQGGSLIQDIPTQVPTPINHRGKGDAPHRIMIDPESRLFKIIGETDIDGWANHHQSVARLGTGLTVVARSADGVVEATELTDHPFGVFVQWHPERRRGRPETDRLFRAFVNACEAR